MPEPLHISRQTARRFLLGIQGLWPGRRWSGKEGVAGAIHALQSVQIDPMTVVARSHDLVMWARVGGYRPEYLDQLLYADRRFFDYGGHLDIYPMAELPHWRLHMKRRAEDPAKGGTVRDQPGLLDRVRDEIEERGPLGNRDFAAGERVNSYRGTKDTGLAMYHLWLWGDLMTHSRRGFQRLYDLRERVAPPQFAEPAPESDAEAHFALKALKSMGLGPERAWLGTLKYYLHRTVPKEESKLWFRRLVEDGHVAEVRIEGRKGPYFVPAGERRHLEELVAGSVPVDWAGHAPSTEDQALFLSPLDKLLARKRTLDLFGFEHLWEVYKPAAKRRWGYYTMPILYGDRLVGRLDPKLDRPNGALLINGLWLEDDGLIDDPAFRNALGRGLRSFADFLETPEITVLKTDPPSLGSRLASVLTP